MQKSLFIVKLQGAHRGARLFGQLTHREICLLYTSYLLIYGEVALLAVNLLWLPPLFSLMGVWLAIPITQGMLAAIGAILLRLEKILQPEGAIVSD